MVESCQRIKSSTAHYPHLAPLMYDPRRMALPDQLRPLLRDPDFWARYFWDESGPEIEIPGGNVDIDFARVDGYALRFHLSDNIGSMALSLVHPGTGEPVELGWDDQAHWHPHVLRWEELDLVSRFMSRADPDFAHPGLTLLLLCRFAPICVNDAPDTVQPLLGEAWRSLGILKDEQIQGHMEFVDRRQDGFCWRQGPLGWTIDNDQGGPNAADVYSLRNAENPEFPHEPLTAYMKLLRDRVGPSSMQPAGGAAPELRLRYDVHLTVPEPERRENRGREVARALDSALKELGIGAAEVSGEHGVQIIPGTHRRTETFVRVVIRGDRLKGIEVLKKTLRAMNAPRDITVELRFPTQESIPWW